MIVASRGYFRAVGLVYGFMAASVILFSAYQGWGNATPPLLVGLLRVSVLLLGGWYLFQQESPRLEWLYALIAGSTVLGAVVLGSALVLRPSTRTDRQV